MRVSQLRKVMDKDDEIIIDDGNKRIDRNRVYKGTARGIKRDDPINKMHIVVIYPYDNKLLVLAETLIKETATVVADAQVIAMSVAEFEQQFSSNKQIIMKMLRVFSNQLRAIHKKCEQILGSGEGINPQVGMASVAQCFYDDERYRSCCDICLKFLKLYSDSDEKEKVKLCFILYL